MAQEHDLRGTGGNRSAEEIRQDIAAKRESIADTVDRLGEKIQGTLDWKGYVMRHPYASLGVAAGAGLLVGGLIWRKQRPLERILDAFSDAADDVAGDIRKSLRRFVVKAGAPVMFKNAMTGVLSKAVSSYVRSRFTDGRR
jgi:hypothetical protein